VPPLSPLTDQQKQEFLQHIRDGDDRAQAAIKIGSTGTRLRKMLDNDQSASYDPGFAADYQEALAARDRDAYYRRKRGEHGEPSDVTLLGYKKASRLTPDELDRFLHLVRDGMPRDTAARQIGTSLVQIRMLVDREPGFAAAYRDAITEGQPHLLERLRAKAYDLAMDGDYRALRDLLLVHDPEFEKLRTSRHEIGGVGGGAVKVLTAVLPDLPPQLLAQVIQEVEARVEQKQLAEGVIDQ
jgi:hypothetical protein